MRYLTIDLGDQRTGLAVGDDDMNIACPVGLIEIPTGEDEGRALLNQIKRAIDEHLDSADELVVGLPLNMDGTEGGRAKIVREFAVRLEETTGRVVHFQDERLTSVEANWSMSQTGMTHREKKNRRDAMAAAAILRDFLSHKKM